jgi:hypothetical protein
MLRAKCVKYAGANAVISLIFAEYLNRLFWHATQSDVSPDSIPQWAIQLTAAIAVCIITAICVITKSLGARLAVIFTSVKVRAPSNLLVELNNDIVQQVLSLVYISFLLIYS